MPDRDNCFRTVGSNCFSIFLSQCLPDVHEQLLSLSTVSFRATFVKALPGESVNDRNDRAIRVAAAWYAKLLPKTPVLLVTNDADNLRKAKLEGLNAMSIQVEHSSGIE